MFQFEVRLCANSGHGVALLLFATGVCRRDGIVWLAPHRPLVAKLNPASPLPAISEDEFPSPDHAVVGITDRRLNFTISQQLGLRLVSAATRKPNHKLHGD